MRKRLAVALVFFGFFGTSPRAIALAFDVGAGVKLAACAQAHGVRIAASE